MKPKIILDCDPGHDDAVAMMLAGRTTEIIGVTTVSGNAPLSITTDNALIMTELLQLDVPVHAGAHRPLIVKPSHAEEVHGITGLDGPKRPAITREVSSNNAVEFIISSIREQDDVWLVPIGPLTNIALAVAQAPDIVEKVAGVSIMGGSTDRGNVTPKGEFNIWADPDAAAIVFDAGFKELRMAGLNLTHQLGIDDEVISQLDKIGNNTANFIADLFRFYLDAYKERTKVETAPLHDPCAVLAVTHPDLIQFQKKNVHVETRGIHTRGMTVIDDREYSPETFNCAVEYSIDRDAALRVIIDAVSTYE